jgi:hypothetical protein
MRNPMEAQQDIGDHPSTDDYDLGYGETNRGQGGRKSKMNKQGLFDPGGGGGGLAKSHGKCAFILGANYSFIGPREPSHVHLLSSSRSEHNLVQDCNGYLSLNLFQIIVEFTTIL